MTPTTPITIQTHQLGEIISRYVEVGFSMAVKYYQSEKDYIRKSQIKSWLEEHSFDTRKFKALEQCGKIRPFKRGMGTNSPLHYSKSEILKAFADADIEQIDVLRGAQG